MEDRSTRTETGMASPTPAVRSLKLGAGAAMALLLLLGAHAGCNTLTGANDFIIEEDGGGDGDGDGSGDGDGPSGTPSGGTPSGPGSGSTTGTPGGVGGGAAASTGGQQDTLGSAPGVSVAEVSIYQGIKRTVMQGGSPVNDGVPIIAGRDALVRVFMATDGSYDGGNVLVRLHLGDGAPLEVTQPVGGGSEQNLGSTVNFQVPGGSIPAGVQWQVEVGRIGGGGAPYAYPASGPQSLGAESVGQALRVVLVPIAYGADGSNRLPDTSPGQVEAYRKRFYGMYPAPQVDVSVRAAVGWNSNVSAGGNGWGNLLEAIAGVREQDNAQNDEYYYGIFAPAPSFGQYCGGGCTAGLGYIGGANDSYTRAAIGLGFSGDDALDTAVHEIGHTHGREHAPCGGVASADGNFPHNGGQIGAWGYDLTTQQLIQPQTPDMMGYCFPIWISDYTYDAIATRMKVVNGAKKIVPAEMMNLTYERISIGADGEATWLEPTVIREPPLGEAVPVTLDTAAGPEDATGAFFPFDHLPGGTLFVRAGAQASALVAEVDGQLVTLTR